MSVWERKLKHQMYIHTLNVYCTKIKINFASEGVVTSLWKRFRALYVLVFNIFYFIFLIFVSTFNFFICDSYKGNIN